MCAAAVLENDLPFFRICVWKVLMSNNPAGWTVKGVCSLIVDLQLGSVALADATHIGSFGHPEQGLKANRRSSRVQLCGLSDAKAAVSGAIWSLTAHHERLLLAGFCLSPPAALGSITAHRDRQKSARSSPSERPRQDLTSLQGLPITALVHLS
jgi:hypothetical protein